MNVFIAYNTESFVKTVQNKFCKVFKYEEGENANLTIEPTFSDDCNFFTVSQRVEAIRKAIFNSISSFYKLNGKNELLFDILDDSYTEPGLYYHIDKNRKKIKESDMIIFVVAEKEISFWQLQESFFASYYDKRICFLTTEKFLKLIKKNKLDNYINTFINQ